MQSSYQTTHHLRAICHKSYGFLFVSQATKLLTPFESQAKRPHVISEISSQGNKLKQGTSGIASAGQPVDLVALMFMMEDQIKVDWLFSGRGKCSHSQAPFNPLPISGPTPYSQSAGTPFRQVAPRVAHTYGD